MTTTSFEPQLPESVYSASASFSSDRLHDDPLPPLERALAGVQVALLTRDLQALEHNAAAVQHWMAVATAQAQQNGVDADRRSRLARAGAQLAAQRQVLGRATASLDRAIDVLMPRESLGLYGQQGRELRQRSSGDAVSA